MGYTDAGLPFSGNNATAIECSRDAAIAAEDSRELKTERYRQWLQGIGRASDHQAADQLGWPLSSICSIRNALVNRGLVEDAGTTEGKYGKKVTLWRVVKL